MDKSAITILILLGISAIAMFSLKPEQKEMTSFESFKKEFGKSYVSQVEEEYRRTSS
jgi:preprotein translocase subunit YajC